jgi:predicted Zn-dependent peptidase
VIAVSVTYNVGSRNERQGRTGFAHLFEHMMFKGSENVGSGEHFLLVFNNGGNMNGTTNEDRTNYFEVLPANQLDLALFLEADRMRSLAITKDNLDNQRNAVQEERRLGVDNQAYGKSGEVQQELIYDNFAYKHTTIGSMDDLNAASVEDVAAFFKMYYAPNNATLVVVGDFKTADALAKVRSNFETITRQPDPPPVDMTEPQQKAERDDEAERPLHRAAGTIASSTVAPNTPTARQRLASRAVSLLGASFTAVAYRGPTQVAAISADDAGPALPGLDVGHATVQTAQGPYRTLTTPRGKLTVSIRDKQGNVTRVERSFSVRP